MIAKPQTPDADYLPARMLNEVTYCPRLFYYEHVEGLFAHNQETVEGELRHHGLDQREEGLPPPEQLADGDTSVRARSVTLASDQYGVLAKMDLIEAANGRVTPVDYKRGRPRQAADGGLEAWDPERVQVAVQALVLREHGYRCDEAVIYYAATKQRIRIVIDQSLVELALSAVQQARQIVAEGRIPPPLEDSPKCPRCSLVAICLPDETNLCAESGARRTGTRSVQRTLFAIDPPPTASVGSGAAPAELRRLVPARDDLRPVYLNTQGLYVGKSGDVLRVKQKDTLVQEVRLNEICQLNLLGNIQLSTQAVQRLCEAEIPVAYFSMGGWFYGITQGLGVKNIFLRREQFRLADIPAFCLRLARALVAGKIANQRTLLQRNHLEPPPGVLAQIKCMQQQAERAESLDTLLGIEGYAARLYFENFAGMLKAGRGDAEEADGPLVPEPGTDSPTAAGPLSFDFSSRNRRPPRDPVNALLSLAYSLLAKDLMIVTQAVGFDPFLGYFHQPRFGRASLALDLMEPFRPLIADSAVLSAINTRMVTPGDFLRAGGAVALTAEGRKKFFRAYEQRMDSLVTHPLFGYRVNYRRLLEIQTRLLARVLTGELTVYPVFTTR